VATKAIVGEKVGMTQVWDDQNRAIPVTVVRVSPARVVQVKTPEKEGYSALQVTWGTRRTSTLTKPELGHFDKAGVTPGKKLVELRLDDVSGYTVGQEILADVFEKGEMIDANRREQGQGLRWWYEAPTTSPDREPPTVTTSTHRAPGSIGACATPGRVFKGTKMAGRYGGGQVTTTNLEVIGVDVERSLVLVKGAVPGPRGGVVVLRTSVKNPMKAGGMR
jgi:large subunit ribosomal protein L3